MAKKDNLTEELKKHFGFDTFKGNQRAIIENVLAGNDTFVLMPTGGGKSLCYQLPSLMMQGTAIVMRILLILQKKNGMIIEKANPSLMQKDAYRMRIFQLSTIL